MKSRIFFKMWLLALVFCGVFIGALSTTSTETKKGTEAPMKGPAGPLKLVASDKNLINKVHAQKLDNYLHEDFQ